MSAIMKTKSYLVDFDRVLFVTALALTIFGIYLQFNIATSLGDNFQMNMFLNQLRSLLLGIVIFSVVFFIPNLSKLLYAGSFWFLIFMVALLIYVLLFGQTAQGGTRWIRVFGFSFQPSQIAHPILIVFYAKYFERKQDLIKSTGFVKFFKDFRFLVFITACVIVLIFMQRHLSTLVVLSLTLISMIFVADFKKSLFIVLIGLILTGLFMIVNLSNDYRFARMELWAKYSLFHKYSGKDMQEIAADEYQVRESLTAITHGGMFGTGSERGRAKHKFLPDVNSDYIFAMIAEQFGFIGGFIVIFLFGLFIFRSMLIGASLDSYFNMLVVIGFGMNIFITAAVNIGVALSALPSTGLPLPFISYGGSALAVNIGMLAVILNLGSKRRTVHGK